MGGLGGKTGAEHSVGGKGQRKQIRLWLLGLAKDVLNNSWLSQERKGHAPRLFMVFFFLREIPIYSQRQAVSAFIAHMLFFKDKTS